ncbi:LIM domain protein [Ostertagia ostertagi]
MPAFDHLIKREQFTCISLIFICKVVQKVLEKCLKCNKTVTERLIRSRGGAWHPGCFVCETCQKPLEGIPFTATPIDKPYCIPCYQETKARILHMSPRLNLTKVPLLRLSLLQKPVRF